MPAPPAPGIPRDNDLLQSRRPGAADARMVRGQRGDFVAANAAPQGIPHQNENGPENNDAMIFATPAELDPDGLIDAATASASPAAVQLAQQESAAANAAFTTNGGFSSAYAKGIMLQEDLEEINDEKTQYPSYEKKAPSTYPARGVMIDTLKTLDPRFDLISGFSALELKNNDKVYFLASNYVKELLRYLSLRDDPATLPDLAITNQVLFEKDSLTKLTMRYEYIVISEAVWKQLVEWFGGGPEIQREVFNERGRMMEYKGKTVRIVCEKEPTKFRRLNFPAGMSITDFKRKVCELFDVNEEKVRIHDFYQRKPFGRIDMPKEMDMVLNSKQIIEDNLIYLELEDAEGGYKIRYNRAGGYAFQPQNDEIDTTALPPVVGAVGLRNLGNTCYMNSILQCLSNIPKFRDYFTSKTYEMEINMTNVLGFQGKMASAFAKLLDKMWSGEGAVVAPYGFRKVVSTHKTEFAGYEQHDSQEFLSQILDAFHEDLNRVKEKPATETPEGNGRPDEVVAAEAFATHKKRNDSVINDMFTGMFKSTVTCPDENCRNVSVTFDPFTVLPLPLQTAEKMYQVINLVFCPMDEQEPVQRMEIIAPRHGPMYLLRKLLQDKLDLPRRNIDAIKRFNARQAALKQAQAPADPVSGYYQDDIALDPAVLYSEQDPGNCGKREIMLFRAKESTLAYVLEDSESLSTLSHAHVIIAYEMFNVKRFSNYCYVPDEDWTRELRFPRESEQEQVPEISANQGILLHGEDNNADTEAHGTRDVVATAIIGDDQEPAPAPMATVVASSKARANAATNGNGNNNGSTQTQTVRRERDPEPFIPSDEPIGELNCPFVMGDVWHGSFMFKEDEQEIRMEIGAMRRIDWGLYRDYCVFTSQTFGGMMVLEEVGLSREDFNRYDVFEVLAIADTKERPYQSSVTRFRTTYETEFNMRGLYFVKKNVMVTKPSAASMNGNGNTAHGNNNGKTSAKPRNNGSKISAVNGNGNNVNSGKSNAKKGFMSMFGKKADDMKAPATTGDSVLTDAEKEKPANKPMDIHQLADSIKQGELEKDYLHGKIILRPEGEPQQHKVTPDPRYGRNMYTGYYHSSFAQDVIEEARSALILDGVVDKEHMYLWGRFQQFGAFTKGEFFLRRWESKNWHTATGNGNYTPRPLYEESRYPEAKHMDTRLLVWMAHRVKGTYSRNFASIPQSFFVPRDLTESEFIDMIRAKFRIYLLQQAVHRGALTPEAEERINDEIDSILGTMTATRSNPKFQTAYNAMDNLRPGRIIDAQSDRLLKVAKDSCFVWIVVDWEQNVVPFYEVRSTTLLSRKENNEKRMTLDDTLQLFSRTEKLNAMNTWYCRSCKEHKEAFKQLQIWSLPEVLVIQFKRFSQDEGRSTADKLETPVDFPLDLDMRDFALNFKVVMREHQTNEKSKLEVEELTRKLKDFQYELVSVSSHVGGGLGFGHYIACAKNERNQAWYEFDDSIVTPKSSDEKDNVANPMAYVVFYVRKSLLEERRRAAEEANEKAADQQQRGEAQGMVLG